MLPRVEEFPLFQTINLTGAELKTIATFNKPEDAHNLRAFLEGFGIAAFVRDEHMAASYALAIGGVRVEVEDADYEKSVAFLAGTPAGEPEAGDLSG